MLAPKKSLSFFPLPWEGRPPPGLVCRLAGVLVGAFDDVAEKIHAVILRAVKRLAESRFRASNNSK
jgi:hypothetical protein